MTGEQLDNLVILRAMVEEHLQNLRGCLDKPSLSEIVGNSLYFTVRNDKIFREQFFHLLEETYSRLRLKWEVTKIV